MRVFLIFALFIACLFASPARANQTAQTAKIIIVLDDVGYRQSDISAFDLPVEVAFAILPQTPHGKMYAEMAHQQGRDVMLHLPMSSMHKTNLGPAALTAGMYGDDIEQTLSQALDSIPHVVGVNNHMGSALTAEPDAMKELMLAIRRRSLFFLDSRTTPKSIAYETAKKLGVPTDKRHIFLDHEQTPEFYEQQLMRLIRIAKKYGRAIGIAHPYPSSMAYLAKALKNIDEHGVELYPVSEFFAAPDTELPNRVGSGLQIAAPSDD